MTFSVSIRAVKKADVLDEVETQFKAHAKRPPACIIHFVAAALDLMADDDYVNVSVSGSLHPGSSSISGTVSKTAAPASPPNA